MVGCVFIAFLMVFTGIYFMAYNLMSGYPYFSYTLSGSLIVFIVGIPLITMRSFSEERKNKTDQLLLTAPVSLGKVVMGKYLAIVTVIAIPNVIFCIYPLIIKSQGTAYLMVDYISILVFFLLGCVYAAIGMFLSSLTESQIIAFIGAAAGIITYIVRSSLFENLLSNLLGRLALANVFTDITSNSIVDITGIVLYLSFIAVFVFLTVQAIQKRRWS